MKVVRFDAAVGRQVDTFGSDFRMSPIALLEQPVRLFAFHLEVGGRVGRHVLDLPQLLCVTAGSGWVAGADGEPTRVSAGLAVHWDAGEEHEVWTDFDDLTAVVLEGETSIWAPAITDGTRPAPPPPAPIRREPVPPASPPPVATPEAPVAPPRMMVGEPVDEPGDDLFARLRADAAAAPTPPPLLADPAPVVAAPPPPVEPPPVVAAPPPAVTAPPPVVVAPPPPVEPPPVVAAPPPAVEPAPMPEPEEHRPSGGEVTTVERLVLHPGGIERQDVGAEEPDGSA